ncbi:MAG: hypothetical protein AAF591_07580 [Verrucomicrobiota bacterium]
MPIPESLKTLLKIAAAALATALVVVGATLLGLDPPHSDDDLLPIKRNVDPSQNPFPKLKRLHLYKGPNDSTEDLDRARKMTSGDEEWDETFVQRLLNRNSKAIRSFEKATHLAEWQDTFEPTIEADFDYASNWIDIAKLLRVRSMLNLRNGSREEAISDAITSMKFGSLLLAAEGGLIHQLTAITTAAIGQHAVLNIFKHSNLIDTELAFLCDELDSISYSSRKFADSFRVEHQIFRSGVDAYNSGKFHLEDLLPSDENSSRLPPKNILLFKPNRTLKRHAAAMRQLTEDSQKARHLSTREISKELDANSEKHWKIWISGNAYGEILLLISLIHYDDILDRFALTLVSHDMIRTRAAIERYRLKHESLPESLDALVPGFIDSIPLDQFSGGNIQYLPHTKVIYSWGINFSDDGGEFDGKQLNSKSDDFVIKIDLPSPAPE